MILLANRIWLLLATAQVYEGAAWQFLAHNSLSPTIVSLTSDAQNSSAAANPHIDKLRRDGKRTYQKAINMEPDEMLKEDVELVAAYLFPGKRPTFHDKGLEILLTLLSILWFVPFFRRYYVIDVEWEAQKEREVKDEAEETLEAAPILTMSGKLEADTGPAPEADLVIRFYNPACKTYSDSESLLPRGALRRTITEKGKKGRSLRRTEKYLGINRATFARKLSRKLSVSFWSSIEEELSSEEEDISDSKTFGTIRGALLQDLYELLPVEGFSVSIFNSVDKDELFLCITLIDEEVTKHELCKHGFKLQMQPRVVEALGLRYLAEIESSPPYIKYDHRLPSQVLGNNCTDIDFYRAFDGPGSKKTIVMSTERIRAIMKFVHSVVDLDMAVKNKLITGWFPAHTRDGLVKLGRDWADYMLLKDLTFVQPLNLIREYFGSRIAFMFAWNGCYSKLLLALVPASIAFEIANRIAGWYGHNEYWNPRSLFGYGVVVAVWTRLASNTWKRERGFLLSFWKLKDAKKDGARRPDYVGANTTSPIDDNLIIKVYPSWKFQIRLALSWFVTAIFCLVNFIVLIMWIDLWQGRLTPAASIVLAILIQIFTQIFYVMVEALTDAENHEMQLSYYNSYLLKYFVFQFVNQYSSFLYIAIKQQFTTAGCPRIDMDNDCIGLLNEQLPVTLVVLTFVRVSLVVVAALQARIGFWIEDYQMRKQGMKVVPRTFLEEQGKLPPFGVAEQVDTIAQLALTAGFVFIFGSVAPRIALLSLIVFMVQLRAGAYTLTHAATRTMPRQAMGVGHVGIAVDILGVFGMAFSGYMLVNFAPLFQGTMILTRVSAFIFWGLFVSVLWLLVDVVCPPSSEKTETLEGRRNYVVKKLGESHADATHRKESGSRPSALITRSSSEWKTHLEYAKLVEEAAWDDIPRLVETKS